VSSRSVSYRQAMILGTIFEMVGAITVGARTAETIKNGIIPPNAFKDDAGVQMLAFTCALAGASMWVMVSVTVLIACGTGTDSVHSGAPSTPLTSHRLTRSSLPSLVLVSPLPVLPTYNGVGTRAKVLVPSSQVSEWHLPLLPASVPSSSC